MQKWSLSYHCMSLGTMYMEENRWQFQENNREIDNVIDCYVVAVKKESGKTTGYISKIFCICNSFLQQG